MALMLQEVGARPTPLFGMVSPPGADSACSEPLQPGTPGGSAATEMRALAVAWRSSYKRWAHDRNLFAQALTSRPHMKVRHLAVAWRFSCKRWARGRNLCLTCADPQVKIPMRDA